LSFNFFSIIDFLSRNQNSSISLIDNTFIDYSHSGKYPVHCINNGLSHHYAQLLSIENICLSIYKDKIPTTSTTRVFNRQSLHNFQMQVSYETWNGVFVDTDIDTIFNSFLKYVFENFFYSSVPLKK
jgi:hypothetical protein